MTQPGWYPDPQDPRRQRWWDGRQWAPPAQWAPQQPPPRKRSGAGKVLLAIGGAVVVLIVIGVLVGPDDEKNSASTTSATETISPEAVRGEAERRAAEATSAAQASSAARAAVDAERARNTDPANYAPISDQDFAILAKDPAAHTGERIVVYGRVSQFDANTGADTMRISAGGQPADWYDYDVNAIVIGDDPGVLAEVVEGNLVTLHVRVNGETSYPTSMGGELAAPEFQAYIAEVTGTTP
ncbi:DUF2510 domain-containing protein [Aldersonia sp. NBC_00410]|uniref:DUF2510 domain-containing protein n=1 Tax=Aldersonia sp. NBC_00410 TaxID=2975954 RepID=UPI0022525F8B|nr:DUF2510 domain-containing protein [Aldersonia sp. NBC_00410]MCX5042460.1 DUF2510 domain-containing protein [Aldersonia sp. NBC_00410]